MISITNFLHRYFFHVTSYISNLLISINCDLLLRLVLKICIRLHYPQKRNVHYMFFISTTLRIIYHAWCFTLYVEINSSFTVKTFSCITLSSSFLWEFQVFGLYIQNTPTFIQRGFSLLFFYSFFLLEAHSL